MKLKTLLALSAAVTVVALASSASAVEFLFTFAGDGGINGASGTLDATANGDGTFTAVSGTITAFGPVVAGSGTLTANPNAPAAAGSPSGFFTYDDQLLPGQNPLITNNGLLFDIGGAEVNIFSNGPGPDTYTIYNNDGDNANGDFALSQVASVPEPATWAMMLVGVGFAGGAMRASRKKTIAA